MCVSQFVAEHSDILFVLVIKLTKETRRRVYRYGGIRDGEIGKGRSRGRVRIDFSLFKPNLRNM